MTTTAMSMIMMQVVFGTCLIVGVAFDVLGRCKWTHIEKRHIRSCV